MLATPPRRLRDLDREPGRAAVPVGPGGGLGFKMGLFNIGVEGQYRLAALVAAYVGGPSRACPAVLHVALIIARRDGRRAPAGPASPAC
jgi:hypothetical protein